MNRLFALFCSCSHRHTTFPMTPASRARDQRRRTYIVCLDCGQEFDYDWKQMRVVHPGAARIPDELRKATA